MASCPTNAQSGSQLESECRTSRRSMTRLEDVTRAATNINPKLLYDIPLIPVDCRFGLVKERPENTMPLKSAVKKDRRAQGGCKVTILFAIRRPGCGNCREHGQQLTEINKLEQDVSFIGVMKHGSGVDDAALLDFYQHYYRFPLYKDEDWKIYKALGGRKFSFLRALALMPRLEARYKKKGIPNVPFGGDIWTQGGVMIFDREGNLRHTVYETYGEELDKETIRQAIKKARNNKPSSHLGDSDASINLDHTSSTLDNSFSTSLGDFANLSITSGVSPASENKESLGDAETVTTASTSDARKNKQASGKELSKEQQRTNNHRASKIRQGLTSRQEAKMNQGRTSVPTN